MNWDESSSIFFAGENAFGLTPDLQTICLGREDTIKKALENKVLPGGLNSIQRETLSYVLEYRKEKENGENFGTGNLERRRTMRIARHRQKTIRLFKARKGFPLHTVKQKL